MKKKFDIIKYIKGYIKMYDDGFCSKTDLIDNLSDTISKGSWQWYILVRNTIIEWAYKQNVNKIICPNNLCCLFDDYKPKKDEVQIEFSSKYSNLIFIGDEVIEVID